MARKEQRITSYVSTPSHAKGNKGRGKKGTGAGISTGLCIAGLIGFAIYLFGFGGLEYLQNLGNDLLDEIDDIIPDDEDTPTGAPVDVPTFPEIVREGDNYVGLVFLSEFEDSNIFDAFLNSAARWSAIVNNTSFTNEVLNAGEPICPRQDPAENDDGFNVTTTLTHLVILSDIVPIDGENGILGSAGPCRIPGSNGNRPVTGRMQFDVADLQGLASDGSLESVILHEMGHVLGIGTLWAVFNILNDPVFNGAVAVNLVNQPKYVGVTGRDEYRVLTGNNGEAFVPVEDGFSDADGVELFNRGQNQGRGSIDGHWDNDFMNNELMEFQINAGSTPPLSRVSIGSLVDFGYTVDFNEADAYSIPTFLQTVTSKLRGRVTNRKTYKMINDIDLSGLTIY